MLEKLTNSTNEILNYLRKIPLSKSTVRYYSSCYKSLISYCKEKNCEFSYKISVEFLEYQKQRLLNNKIQKIYYLLFRKSIYTLLDYLENGVIYWNRRNYKSINLCNQFIKILDEFKTTLIESSLSEGSINLIIQLITRFLVFLESKKIYEIKKVEISHVKTFIINLAPNFKANIINLTWPLKKFFLFLNTQNYSTLNVTSILANPVSKRKKVLPCFSIEEINTMISSIDTSTSIGKRDYAMIKLSVGTGLRGVDILNLCFSNIDWRNNKIKVIQHKTKQQLVLPLSADVGNAIADYILNARPSSKSNYIFLKEKMPYEKLNKGATANSIKRCMTNANITHSAGDGKSFHALRRTFGTELVKANIPLPTVSQLLGHNSINTSKQYICLNDEMLKVCCMDISKYATTKEGLI